MKSVAAVKIPKHKRCKQLTASIQFASPQTRKKSQSYIFNFQNGCVSFFFYAQKLIPLHKSILRAHAALTPCEKCQQLE